MNKLFLFLALGIFLISFSSATDISTCRPLNETGVTYVLTGNVSSDSTCFNVTAHNVTLDCDGYYINFSKVSTGYGVNTTGYNNLTIKDCNIRNDRSGSTYSYGVFLTGSNNSKVLNSTFYEIGTTANTYNHLINSVNSHNMTVNQSNFTINGGRYTRAISIDVGDNANINDNSIDIIALSTNLYGIYFLGNADRSYVANNLINGSHTTIYGSFYEIYSVDSDHHYITNNTLVIKNPTSFVGLAGNMYFSSCENLTLKYNNMSNDQDFGITFVQFQSNVPQYFNHSIDTTNYVEGKPVLYLFDNHSINLQNLNNEYGQIIVAYSNNSVVNNLTIGDGLDGIAYYRAFNATLTNSTINSTSQCVSFYNVYNSNINNVSVYGVRRYNYGLYIYGSYYNNISNIYSKPSASTNFRGISLYQTQNNRLVNITVEQAGAADGIQFYISSNNYLDNARVNQTYGSTTITYALYINDDCYDNVINNSVINSSSGSAGYGIYIQTDKTNTSVYNSVITSKKSYDILVDNDQDPNSFLKLYNVTWNESDAVIRNQSLVLYNYNYLDVNVTASSSAVEGANVTGYNSSGLVEFSELTDSLGFVRNKPLLEFNQTNVSGKILMGNYTINTTKDSYANDSQEVNMGGNLVLNVGLISEGGEDTCTCPSINTNWEISLSDNCVISTNCNLGTGNITFINTGTITLNATINAKTFGGLPANQKGYLGSQARVYIG